MCYITYSFLNKYKGIQMNYGVFNLIDDEHNDNTIEPNLLEEIASEEAYTDALSIESEIKSDIIAMSQAQVASERIEEQISHEAYLLDNPESINSDCVTLSQEALTTTAMLLGADTSTLLNSVSQESINNDPVRAMELAHEGPVDFLVKVVNAIKGIFRKVMNSAKKLYVKLVVAMDGTAKKAQKLKTFVDKQLKGRTPSKSMFSDDESEKMRKTYPALYTGFSKQHYVSYEANVAVIDNYVSILLGHTAALDKLNPDDPNFANQKSKINKNYSMRKKAALTKLKPIPASVAEKIFDYNPTEDNANVAITSISPKRAHMIEFYLDDDSSDPEEGINAKFVLKAKTASFETDSMPDGKIKVRSTQELSKDLEGVIRMAKALPGVKNMAMSFIAKADKALDLLAKTTSTGKFSYMVKKIKAGEATKLRDMAVTNVLNTVLDAVKMSKADYSDASKHIDAYGYGEM